MPIKSVKIKISKNKKMRFFLISQGSLNPKIRVLGQKVCPAARGRTDTQTDTHKSDYLSGFQEFFLQPIIKDRPNMIYLYLRDDKKIILTSFVNTLVVTVRTILIAIFLLQIKNLETTLLVSCFPVYYLMRLAAIVHFFALRTFLRPLDPTNYAQ